MSSSSLNEEDLKCLHCHKIFKTKYTLKSHIERNKVCLKKRGETINSNFKCTECNFVFMLKTDLTRHIETCKAVMIKDKEESDKKEISKLMDIIHEKNKQLEQRDSQIANLLETIKQLAGKAIDSAKPTTINHTTNNTINNLHIISKEHVNDQAKHLTIEHIKKGALGYSEYFLEHPLKERIVCTDYSRRKIKYKNEQGEIVTDPEMTNLSDLLFKSIKDRNRELTIQYSSELSDKFKTAKDPSQLSYFMEMAGKFSQQDLDVFKMFNGVKNEFFHDVLRNICSKTLV